jgi:hypothetical protein
MMNENEKETFGGGVESYEGAVPKWLMAVYAVLMLWGIYYLVKYWGGFGPMTGE